MFLLKKWFWFTLLKVAGLAFVAGMIYLQIPELIYDLGPSNPVVVDSMSDLESLGLGRARFASVTGTPDFDHAFIYQRYGLSYTYFLVEPYGLYLVARTYEEIDDTWAGRTGFVGKLKKFEDQPFSYAIAEIFVDQFGESVPEGAYFIGLFDVPKANGWQIGAIIFAALMWVAMFYVFFILLPKRERLKAGVSGKEKP